MKKYVVKFDRGRLYWRIYERCFIFFFIPLEIFFDDKPSADKKAKELNA